MHYVVAALLAVGLVIMGFIGGVWFALNKVKTLQVTLPEDLSEDEVEKVAKDLVDRMNKYNKRDE